MRHRRWRIVCCAAAVAQAGACGGDDNPVVHPDAAGMPDAGNELPTAPPTAVSMVIDEGFRSPTDAVASPDGSTFYFAAFTTDDPGEAGVFKVAAAGGSASEVHAGDPLSYVSGLVLSCDGATLYLADQGGDGGGLYSLAAGGGTPSAIAVTGLGVPSGLAISHDCTTLYVSGRNADDEGAVFTVPLDGGSASVLAQGDPLMAPTGIYVDADDVAWVIDHLAGEGALFSIPQGGVAHQEIGGLVLGTPGGVSLTAGGGTAVIATRDRVTGAGQLTALDIASGEATVLAAPAIVDPAGLRTARGAGIFAVADSEGDAIFAAQ